MAEWLYEDGIGESRAALVEDGRIVEALIEWNDVAWPAGTVTEARIGEIDRAHGRGFVLLPDASAAILSPVPPGLPPQGSRVHVEIVREPIAEGRREKWPKARLTDAAVAPALPLYDRLAPPVRHLAGTDADALEAAGWSELIEEAASGWVAFPGGALLISLTPAMTLLDVDGTLPPAELAMAGAAAAAAAIRRLGLSGSIGIDLPSVEGKAARAAAAEAFDALMPQPFERTAVNGFGFLQIIRPRVRRSLPEMIASDPAGAALRLLLRRAERCGGHGAIRLIAAPSLTARLEAHPEWTALLAQRTGRRIHLQPDTAMATWGGHVEAEHP